MQSTATFWDNIAEKYAADPIRDQAAYEYTLQRTRSYLTPDDHVLEIGCGTGSTALLLAEHVASYHGTDISGEMIRIARSKVAETSIANLSFETSSVQDAIWENPMVNVICAFSILHLLRDLDSVLAAAHERLPKGGLLISKTPCLRSMGLGMRIALKVALPLMQLLGKAPFVQSFGKSDLERKIEAAGFEIVETVPSPKGAHHYVVARRR